MKHNGSYASPTSGICAGAPTATAHGDSRGAIRCSATRREYSETEYHKSNRRLRRREETMPVRLQVNKEGKLNYYSITEGRWMTGTTGLSLRDICAISPQERDTLLEYYQRAMRLGRAKRFS